MAIPLDSVASVGVQPRSTAVALLRPLATEARQALFLFPQISAFHRLGSSSSVRGFSSVRSSSIRSKNRLSVSCQKQQQQAIDGAGVVTESDWDKLVLESDVPVLVDFWAPWCGPCRMIETIVDDLAKEYYGRVRFFKLNTDEYPNIATRYGIRSIPTVMIFNQGDKKDTVIGAVPKTTLVSTVEKYLQL